MVLQAIQLVCDSLLNVSSSVALLAQLLLSISLDHVLLDVWQHGCVHFVLHREFTCEPSDGQRANTIISDASAIFTLALCHSTQLTRISKHVVQRYLGGKSELVISHFGVNNRSSPLVESSNNSTCDDRISTSALLQRA